MREGLSYREFREIELQRIEARLAILRKRIRKDLRELPAIVRWLLILLSPTIRSALFDE